MDENDEKIQEYLAESRRWSKLSNLAMVGIVLLLFASGLYTAITGESATTGESYTTFGRFIGLAIPVGVVAVFWGTIIRPLRRKGDR